MKGRVVQKPKQTIKVDFVIFFTPFHSFSFLISLYLEDVAEDVLRGRGRVRHHSVHAVQALLGITDLGQVRGGGHNIGHLRVFLWQVRREIHLFPPIFFFALNSRESEF